MDDHAEELEMKKSLIPGENNDKNQYFISFLFLKEVNFIEN